jgi:hypothetical protein
MAGKHNQLYDLSGSNVTYAFAQVHLQHLNFTAAAGTSGDPKHVREYSETLQSNSKVTPFTTHADQSRHCHMQKKTFVVFLHVWISDVVGQICVCWLRRYAYFHWYFSENLSKEKGICCNLMICMWDESHGLLLSHCFRVAELLYKSIRDLF